MRLPVALVALAVAALRPSFRQEAPLPGCYRVTPALGYVANGRPERADSAWGILQLLANGKVARPLLQQWSVFKQQTSTWQFKSDTLKAGLGDGHSGWSMVLTKDGPIWRGVATYSTDVEDGSEPFRQPVAVEARKCPGSA